jgi:hypothetical protein
MKPHPVTGLGFFSKEKTMAVKKTAPKKTAPKQTPKKNVDKMPEGFKRFISTKVVLVHPFQRVSIPMGSPGIMLDEQDEWIKSQVIRGLVKEM